MRACRPRRLPPPSPEERLCAAAHTILTDGRSHSGSAQSWALDYLVSSANGRPTAFTRKAAKRLAHH